MTEVESASRYLGAIKRGGVEWFGQPWAPAIVSAVAALILYAITLGGSYIYDDLAIVRDDPRVRNPSQWGQLWTRDYFNGGADNLYRPLVSTSYALEWFFHGDRPWIFHLVNVLLHAGATATVAELTRRGLGRSPSAIAAATIAGLLFAAHPLHVEAVADIVGRAELACALAVLGGLAILAHRPLTTGRAIAVLICGVVGVLCKEQGILQPFLWALFGWCGLRQSDVNVGELTATRASQVKSRHERRAITLLALLTTWLWAGYLIGREHFLKFEWDTSFLDPMRQPLLHSIGIDRILMPIVLIGHYTVLFIWPAHLSLDYGGDVIGSQVRIANPFFWIGIVAMLGWFLAVLVALTRKAGFIVLCLISMAATYGVVGNIITLIGTNFAERLMYLPSAFLLMSISAILVKLPVKPRVFIVAIVLLLSSIKTFTAAADWNDPLVLYKHSLEATPKSIQLHLLLFNEYRAKGDPSAADAVLVEACEQYPNYWLVWMFRAIAAMDDGELTLARRYLKRAIYLEANPILFSAQDRLQKLQAATRPSTK